ncbi:MAG: PhoH family protein [Candidatus Marinimicrobia bacterium]|jgi:phosphate starvation-inducible PhoH-like protein|nr:PhoH family protein [Candidatus Neomarinimicrobiota bacterium]MDP7217391.1 PhoH family protein [Candidatus Neomarinimicrobiota bacterium]MDP7437373.1 PhoH family protein [Candidatus Neomarinimicrobiota bacterium]HBN44850.1 phosphate starvation-inducible protein PhoH [Candidatus Neomarinimicrobiota bacterium]|tara:strand:- start:2691 stop:3632 length:942 start_codon:yes stop_codon:yes gene_type:complete
MKKTIALKGIDLQTLLGVADGHVRLLNDTFSTKILVRGNEIKLDGQKSDVEMVHEIIHEMIQTLSRKGTLTKKDVRQLIKVIQSDNGHVEDVPDDVIHYGRKGAIIPRTTGQKKYVQVVNGNDIVFSVGPAGTGKTFIAVAFAVAMLENHDKDRIILCRPAVEAGESLGFLPGDLKEKVDPYLTPLYDALNEMMPANKLKPLLIKNIIEVIPLAYMRGRTLNNAFLILDEAQNSTPMQMKMFLTRLGVNSKAIITGDITQIDLPKRSDSGLIDVLKVLNGVDGIGFVELDENDVVRHKLVRDIIKAYDKANGQ